MKKINSIEIKNSSFFEDITIEFENQLNCIMGGRGTGKTTLMYFVSSCLDKDAEENKDIFNILKENLQDGEITLWIQGEDSTDYKIVKTFGDEPQPYLHPMSDYIALDKISSSIECDFYKAGEIEEIGRSKSERLRLLDKRIQNDISKLKNELKEVQFDLDSNAQEIKNSNSRLQSMLEIQSQFFDAEEDFENHKINQPKNINDKDRIKYEQADKDEKIRNSEKRFFSKTIDFLDELSKEFDVHLNEITTFKSNNRDEVNPLINKSIIESALNVYDSEFKQIEKSIEGINIAVAKLQEKMISSLDTLDTQHEIQQAEFIKLKQSFDVNREYVNKYNQLSKRVEEKNNLIKEIEEFKSKNDKLHNERKSLIEKLNKIKSSIFNLRHQNIIELNHMFEGVIIITLEFCGNKDDYEQLLRDSLKGSGLRYNELIPKIVEQFTPDKFAEVIHKKNIKKLKEIDGIDETRGTKLIDTLYNTNSIFDIEKLYCDDLPNFKLKIHEGETVEKNYRVSEELSLGQRCTTVLPIIFAISDNPLFIDQPEDNLDNRFITDQIHEIIRTQKQKRQIIFITHNPNIPVLSDAEANIFLNYERKSSIEAQGNISDVKNFIVNLLEGGEKAFLTRKTKYGY